MNRGPWKSRLAGFSTGAGEWMHYAAAIWLASRAGGLTLVGLYLVVSTLPGAFLRVQGDRHVAGSLLTAAALVGLVAFRPLPPVGFLLAGAAAGTGAALAGRPTAWTSGLNAFHGYSGIVGGIAAVLAAAFGGPEWALVGAALLITLGALAPNRPRLVGPLPRALYPATAAVGFCVGMRVVEPGPFEGPVASAVFVTAWAMGMNVAASSTRPPDARLVVGAPFLAAAVLAGLGVVTGPAWVFLYGVLAACVGFVGRAGGSSSMGTSSESPDRSRSDLWPGGRRIGLGGAVLGAAWASQVSGLEAITAGAAAAALAGGFLSLAFVRRADAVRAQPALPVGVAEEMAELAPLTPDPAEPREELPLTTPSASVEPIDPVAVLQMLRSALAEAREIRTKAIAVAIDSSKPFVLPVGEVSKVIDELLVSAGRAGEAARVYLARNVTSAIPTE